MRPVSIIAKRDPANYISVLCLHGTLHHQMYWYGERYHPYRLAIRRAISSRIDIIKDVMLEKVTSL